MNEGATLTTFFVFCKWSTNQKKNLLERVVDVNWDIFSSSALTLPKILLAVLKKDGLLLISAATGTYFRP